MNDARLLEKFSTQDFTEETWTHEMHVRVAFALHRVFDFDQALNEMRNGIQKLNAKILAEQTGVPQQTGYHETLTVAWMQIIRSTINFHDENEDSASFYAAQPQLQTRSIVRLFYTRDRLLSDEARTQFVSSDLTDLPRLELSA